MNQGDDLEMIPQANALTKKCLLIIPDAHIDIYK